MKKVKLDDIFKPNSYCELILVRLNNKDIIHHLAYLSVNKDITILGKFDMTDLVRQLTVVLK